MDRWPNFQTLTFKEFSFSVEGYKEYIAGCLVNSGFVNCEIAFKQHNNGNFCRGGRISVQVKGNALKGKILSSESLASQGNHSLQGATQSYRGWKPLGPYPPGTLRSEEEGQHLPMHRHRDGFKTGRLLLQRQPASARAEGVVAWFGFIDSGGSQEALSQLVERGKSRCSQSHSY